jgi:hypothetical protein
MQEESACPLTPLSIYLYFTIEVPHLHKPNIFGSILWLSRRRVWGKIKSAHYLRNCLGEFHEADVLAQASP